jgi:hypothetical protein
MDGSRASLRRFLTGTNTFFPLQRKKKVSPQENFVFLKFLSCFASVKQIFFFEQKLMSKITKCLKKLLRLLLLHDDTLKNSYLQNEALIKTVHKLSSCFVFKTSKFELESILTHFVWLIFWFFAGKIQCL